MTGRPQSLRGNEPWTTVSGIALTYWDLWLLVLAARLEGGFSGVSDRLRDRIRQPGGFARDDSEAKLAQLDHLQGRLQRVGARAADLVRVEARDAKIVAKSKTKVLEQTVPTADYTPAMAATPRRRFEERALRGHWPRFPVSPGRFDEALSGIARAHAQYDLDRGLGLARRLESAWNKAAARAAGPAETLAVHRAMMTACLEAQERADDSCGRIGEVFSSAIESYAHVPHVETGLDPELLLRDAIEFATWEDFGHGDELTVVIRGIRREHGDLAVLVFEETVAELEAYGLFAYQVRQASGFWAELLVAHRRFEEFVALATRLGADAWKPIVSMAEAAMKSKKRDLALAVLAAADRPGTHRTYLAEQCVKITGQPLPAPVRLVRGHRPAR